MFTQKSLKNGKSLVSSYKKRLSFGVFRKIKRHFDNLLAPTHTDYSSAIVDPNTSMYTNVRQFQAFLTKNAYDMAIFNEYDLWPHTNFGTIDNPLLIFSADASWRLVLCGGPGSEEESSAHEKMSFIVREGPIHRCSFCGQCFKLIRLKDHPTDEKNMYYSSIFTEISLKVLAEPEKLPYQTFPWASHEIQLHSQNISPMDRDYVFVNADEADHLMTDPAKRLEFYKQMEEDFLKIQMVVDEVTNQQKLLRLSDRDKLMIPRDVFERWYEVERAILKFDRSFNRYEKFAGRAFFDPENHERRERRMLERKAQREKDNYTYYFGGLTEQEQMFRDYYESDLEEYPDNENLNQLKDEASLRESGDFDLKFIELVESHVDYNERQAVQDIFEQSLFKYKYRKVADPKFESRNQRVVQRFLERAKHRDPRVVEQLFERVESLYSKNDNISNALDYIKTIPKGTHGMSGEMKHYEDLMPFAKYVAEEGYQQFQDYYETDEEEGAISEKAEMWKDLNEQNKLRFVECYDNYFNKGVELDKYYVTIPKRPYDNRKSIAANFFEDLVDFNNRVRPIQRTLAFQDAVSKYQSLPLNSGETQQTVASEERYRKVLNYQKSGHNLLDEWNKNEGKH